MKRMVMMGALLMAACLLPAEDRVVLDRQVGRAELDGGSVAVSDGLAAVRRFADDTLELWAGAPALDLQLVFPADASRPYRIDVLNAMPGSVLRPQGMAEVQGTPIPGSATGLRFELEVVGISTSRSPRPTTAPTSPSYSPC
ncbi:MAG: hypothetical protein RL385_1998 [Pseudomonadota bacterium]|jgi:hypothetical protein